MRRFLIQAAPPMSLLTVAIKSTGLQLVNRFFDPS
jgi:hypothetical protein